VPISGFLTFERPSAECERPSYNPPLTPSINLVLKLPTSKDEDESSLRVLRPGVEPGPRWRQRRVCY